MFDLIVIGGGAAGFFSALIAKEYNPQAKILLLEKNAVFLSKVRISGGGRCNVTNATFDPKSLCQNYPRGSKELLGPFHTFNPRHTIEWFEKRGVELKTEEDGRIFPTTDSSETIISCLQNEAIKLKIPFTPKQKIEKIDRFAEGFTLTLKEGSTLQAKRLLIATGSSADGHEWAQNLGHTIEKPIPSLFTFNVPSSDLKDLSGITVADCSVTLKGTSFHQRGALLITHFGFSGPTVIKLSAFAAPFLYDKNYQTEVVINWLPSMTKQQAKEKILEAKKTHPQSFLINADLFSLPKNLKKALYYDLAEKKMCDLSNKNIETLLEKLFNAIYPIDGKTTHKQEFVTCGGVSLKEIQFQTMESKVCPNLYFAGEVLNIDGVTGGFNFQNAWTTGFIFGKNLIM